MQNRLRLVQATEEVKPGPGLPSPIEAGSAWIVTALRRAILGGRYDYRERLPAERELAAHYGASRSTVRVALQQLEDMRLVTRRVGAGTFVAHDHDLRGTPIAEQTSPLQLIDVRLAVEPEMARLAVLNAASHDFMEMGRALESLLAVGGDREKFSKADEAFHQALALCSHNPLLVWLYRQVNAVRGHHQWAAMKEAILTEARIAEYNRQHERLFEALRSRDADAAVRLISDHLESARDDLLGARSEDR